MIWRTIIVQNDKKWNKKSVPKDAFYFLTEVTLQQLASVRVL
jgi:hypothetical protein